MAQARTTEPIAPLPPLLSGLGSLPGALQFAEGATGWGHLAGTFSADPVTILQLAAHPEPAGRAARDWIEQLKAMARRMAEQSSSLFLSGYLSYDFGRLLLGLPSRHAPGQDTPLAWAGAYDWQIQGGSTRFARGIPAGRRRQLEGRLADSGTGQTEAFTCSRFELQDPPRHYEQAFARLQEYIKAGDCYQANLSHLVTAQAQGNPAGGWLRGLQAGTPPFAAYLATNHGALLSFSPEEFIVVEDGQVRTRPIKGTRPRGVSEGEDQSLREQLLHSEKDRAENLMIVDLLRNDLGQHCRTGSVAVPELFRVESYPAVHHLVSTITGTLRPSSTPLDLLAGCLPGGSITGAPKRRAMEIIDELETGPRHVYCGTQFVLLPDGKLISSILIRTVLLENGIAHCRGGGGIVADSTCADEAQEARDKITGILSALSAS